MKILVICQYYYPEPFRISDICEEMVKRGHEITVVTGTPNYPEGEIYKGYENNAHADEVINGVYVHRCPIFPRKTGVLHRMLNYFSYPWQAKKYVKNLMASDGKPFDVVFVNQLSPVMMAEPAIAYKKRYGTPVVMYCLDLWPESLVAGGIKKDTLIYKIFHKISKRIYNSMDEILITSKMFREYLVKEFYVGSHKIKYLPQFAENIFEGIPYREPSETINLLFAGNIGAAQSVDTIIRAAQKLECRPVHFHIVGDGSERKKLEKMAEHLENVTFYGRRSLEEMPKFYAMADAMLVTLSADPVLSLTLPGKIQSYMAAGKPIIGAIDGEAAKVIEEAECGYCGRAGNVSELVKRIALFMENDSKAHMGENARKYYKKFFTKKNFIEVLENTLAM